MAPQRTPCPPRPPATRRRRPRIEVVDHQNLVGHWGFAPAGEAPGQARGCLSLEPSGLARWTPPAAAGADARRGLWCLAGTHLVLALDGGAAFSGPVVPMSKRLLWGAGVWVRLVREASRPTLCRTRARAMGTRVTPRPTLARVAPALASAAALLMALGALLPS
ncbi:MAG: hypothetical protein ABIJ09_15600 [Pseudomonadota bacterium]